MNSLEDNSAKNQNWFKRALEELGPLQRKVAVALTALIILGIAAILCINLGLFSGFPRWFSSSISTTEEAGPTQTYTPEIRYREASERAKTWQADAKLSYLVAEGTSRWKLIFTSENGAVEGRGYLVLLEDAGVVGAEEIAYSGAAAEFPVEDIITADEAVRRVRAMRGYEDARIVGIEAVYGPSEEVWYWGVRTAKGVVTIEAKRTHQ
jgi:hypothetical protein